MTELPPGRFRALAPRDFPRDDVPYSIEATGPIRFTNTKHGARILVEVSLAPGSRDTDRRREFFVSLRSASYVRLCSKFGEDVTAWRGRFVVRVVRHPGDRRARVEVQP